MVAGSEMRREYRPLIRLALPIVVGELGWMTMGLVDTMMVGRVGKEAMGAVSVGGILFFTVAVFGMGVMLGLDTLVAQAFGAGRLEECGRALVSGLWVGVGLAPVVMGAQWASIPLMSWIGVHPAVVREATPYLEALVWSTPPLLVYAAFRRYLQAMNLVKPVMAALVSANLVNAGANWVWIFGKLGFPALGTTGAGWATCVSRLYLALFLVGCAVWNDGRLGGVLRRARWRPDAARVRELLALGVPAATQIVVEVGVFALATALIGRLEPVYIAAHQIALGAASYSYMVPLGVGSAAAVRVGQAIGRGDFRAAAVSGWAAVSLGVAFMLLAGVTYLLAPQWIGRVFTNDFAVIEEMAPMLGVVALFQLFDGAQAVTTGALRGAGNTRIAALAHLVGYWMVGLPCGAVLCFWWGWGAVGLWVGLCIALILIGVLLTGVWWRMTRDYLGGARQAAGR